ncbi:MULTISPECIES: DUF4440 domain-containing protein [Vibrio]|uniref:DUF4440 domain-containing protein n=1 Tax=Vibrio mediterranei TaxID=689 RepID=A0A3G4VDS0_9VIBR|nr:MULTISPECIES: DUF4440 domain-containing protein [Vibrio]AYV22844.1 DUF4440 domain-containing protein [Vibrio mediterranei]EDL51372.1 hypothetical protein VSAK1_25435 [Vibrio mediterranei AK1]NUW72321.1 DUF4440 domain-containing protein [Vibrio mediterranei]USE01928.1 DUF4440 domain-containing protein [Vibrio sp. SCSIO 43133]
MEVLIEQEIALHQFEVRQDKVEIERLIHPGFREVGRSGNSYDFKSIVRMMETEKPSNVQVHSQNYECVALEPTVQLLTYESALIDDGGQVSNFTKRSSIWVLVGELWQLKYHQGTPCDVFEIKVSRKGT